MRRCLIAGIAVLFLIAVAHAAPDIKEPDLAGSWYPASQEELARLLDGYLQHAAPPRIDGALFGVIVPHAGYRFSGPVAAYAYQALRNRGVKTVVVVGFTHRKAFDGIAVYDRGTLRTPLGDMTVDAQLASAIKSCDRRLISHPDAFRDENSVEMQLPFIQAALGNVSVVPIAFGTQSYADAVILANALGTALAGRSDCVVVASTDLSHYHPYDEANAIDRRTIALIAGMKTKELYDESALRICELCGIMPVTATLLAADKLGFSSVAILKYANSGDTFGQKDGVVGYLSAALYRGGQPTVVRGLATNAYADEISPVPEGKGAAMLNDRERKRLLAIARESMTQYVRDRKRASFSETDAVLNAEMGAFVTLREKGELRGCIGNMVGRGPLYRTVAAMAIEAATGDPRFPAMTPDEIDAVTIEISVLSPMKRVASYRDVTIPGDGVLIRRGYRSGVFLPQVATEERWDRDTFLSYLCAHKAGLPADAWKDPATEILTFQAEVFGEEPTR